ncbi:MULTISPECIES: Z1 domain-containing protein [Bacillus]|uniref:Z1 domain-containing protein n=1 Tax=Bacillus TaxID=1386 RepID=UPI0022801952|nr:Z1 domain-containing protein [Bacillus subtilis]MCY7783043.1 Z1 domain-containing protein [Bacillus sp. S20C3]MCY8287262.1 Z1 domain-containing protein [Bacillus sp. N13C7]MCY8639002.1 Z1 domain-containing protein [Bacillus sp. S17B2]MCY9144536.1 Z1 domain-containing protein [Bacillus sp. T9C1]MCY8199023.1 Z1 domain-containing protein [Bacillus subtilis]
MNETMRENYKATFKTIYHAFQNSGINSPFERAQAIAEDKLKTSYHDVKESDLESLALEMFELYGGYIDIPKSSILKGTGVKNWFDENALPVYSYFWPRYRRYLEEYKNWERENVDSIHESTNKILRSIGNPKSTEAFDVRGLVLGYVQSGKTANFTGLINKAFDVGYKLVIVLAGMHNDLRSQTQIRLEEEVVGRIDENTDEKIGVAKIRNDGPLVTTWTTKDKDITVAHAKKRDFLSRNLLVVKKNKSVLESLKEILLQSIMLSKKNEDVPVLIIDDEADQASVDTSNPNKEENPKTINKLIREILELFRKKSYVGYTATPFANLLIRTDAKHDTAGKDLYPKDFVVALPKPKGYCGPAEYFNVTGYLKDNKPLLLRHLNEEDLNLFNSMKKTIDSDKFNKVPKSMREAIFAFLIAIAVRNLRGQNGKHNSMLIHTSRFTDTQGTMTEVIERYYQELCNDILYNSHSSYITELKELYLNDHLLVQREFDKQLPVYDWKEVFKEIKTLVSNVRIMEINGQSGEALEYETYKDVGLNVIVVGGDKLSRGLTLEGLSVSYYYRGTNMYDTLMQMGRWFGFRTGYMDLCRIYTSETISDYFEHMAFVMVELRKEFEYIAKNENVTPEEYAIKMLDHEDMQVTSIAKMRYAKKLINYSGMRQTRIFDSRELIMKKNFDATLSLINEIETPITKLNNKLKKDTEYYISRDVTSRRVIDFLKRYETPASVNKVNSKDIASFIERMNSKNELQKFNVIIVGGTNSTLNSDNVMQAGLKKYPVNLGKIKLETAVIRAVEKVKNSIDNVDIGAIVASNQEFVDLEQPSQTERNKHNAALLVYPLHPGVKLFKDLGYEFNENFVPVGFAFSFPEITEKYTDDGGKVIKKQGKFIVNKTVKRGNKND